VTNPVTAAEPPAAPAYISDIRQQPQSLQRLLDSPFDAAALTLLRRLPSFDRIVLTGMGASLHASYPAFLALAAAGLPVWHVEAAELLGAAAGLITRATLLWITSQSGRSAEITALLGRLPARRPAVLGLTSDTASPLAQSADAVIELHCGAEHAVGTRSYVNSLAAHARGTAVALDRQLAAEVSAAPSRLADYLGRWDEHIAAWEAAVSEPVLFAVGRGASLAAARTGALVIKEAARTPIEAMSAPQFRHGPLEMADSRTCIIVLPGGPADAPLNQRLAADLAAFGANAVTITRPRDGGGPYLPDLSCEQASPLGEILPFQLLSVVLARRLGHEPGAFRQIGKVTTTL
jgi:glucosamine--fructose-6-phosphate aminotransferase (isomerizing)